MNKETLRMQMLAGIITESQYKAKLNEIGITPIIIDADDAIELDFSESDEVSFVFDTPEDGDDESWDDSRETISVNIEIIQKFLRDQSKNKIDIPVWDGYGVMTLDRKYAESIMDSFYENYPYLDPTNPDYEGPDGFGLN